MNLTDKVFTEKWEKNPISRAPQGDEHWTRLSMGGKDPAMCRLWCSVFSEALGDMFKEGMRILDYGCGRAVYFYFLSGWLEDFTYFGIEPKGAYKRRHIKPNDKMNLEVAREYFSRDNRATFGELDSDEEKRALSECSCVILASVFTHLRIADTYKILDKLLESKSIQIIVFSAMISKLARVSRWGANGGLKHSHGASFNTMKQYEDYFEDKDASFKIVDHYFHTKKFQHTIFHVQKCEGKK